MGARRTDLDWHGIEQEYRAGQMSVAAIARLFGCSDMAIHKRAKRNGWVRNSAEVIRAQIEHKLAMQDALKELEEQKKQLEELKKQKFSVYGPPPVQEGKGGEGVESGVECAETSEEPIAQEQMVKLAASRGVQVVREHRREVNDLRSSIQYLLDCVRGAFAAGMTIKDAREQGFLGERETFTEAIWKLSQALERAQRLERTAFNLDDKRQADQPVHFTLNLTGERSETAQTGPKSGVTLDVTPDRTG